MHHRSLLCLLVVVSVILGLVGPVAAQPARYAYPQDVQATTVTLVGTPTTGTGSSGSTVTFDFTTGTGSNLLMLVGVAWNSGTATTSVESVTFSYGSGPTVVNLSQKIVQASGDAKRYAAIWYVTEDSDNDLVPSGQLGTVTVTFSASFTNGMVAGAATFAGVDQTTPLGTAAGAGAQNATPSVTFTGLTGNELVFDTIFVGGSGTIQDPTAGDDQVKRWTAYAANARGAASTEDANSATSVTMSWSIASTYWALAAVPINPAPVGPTHNLNIAVEPAESGTTVPSAGTHTYAENSVVDVTATAAAGYKFASWSGACSGTDPDVCQVTMDADKTVTANFTALQQYTLAVGTTGNGTVTLDPAGGTYYEDTTVTLTPVPGACDEFVDWSGDDKDDIIDTDGVYTIKMDGNKSVTADFNALPKYTLTADDDGNGSVTLNPPTGPYCTGTTVTLTPVPESGYIFGSWSGTNSGDLTDKGDGTWSILMGDNKSVTANFAVYTPPTVDGPASSGTADDVDTIDIDHTTGTGTNRLMLVGVSWNCGTTNRTISSVTFTPSGGGDAIELEPVITQQTGTQLRYSAIYSLLNPPSEDAGTVKVTFDGTVSNGIVAGVANFAGVDQTDPLGTPGGAGLGSNDTAPTVTLTGLSGDELVFDNVFLGAPSDTQTLTAGSEQTGLWNAVIPNTRAAASAKEAASATSVTMSWTAGSAAYWAIAAVPINPPANKYTVTYNGNDNTGGEAPTDPSSPYNYGATVTVLGNTGALVKTGHTFAGWNTQADGLGTSYDPADTFVIGAANVTLYAKWTINQYTVTYNGNGNTSGTAPTDTSSPYNYGATVTVLGNTGALVKTGHTFAGWNAQADGLGTSYDPADTFVIGAANVTLYAKWTATCYALTLGHDGNGTTPTASPTNSAGCPAGGYVAGEVIDLSGATPDLGWGIASWYGTDDDESTGNTNSLTMPAAAHSAGVDYLRLLGDVDMDGDVTSSDALIVLTVDAGLPAAVAGYCPMNYGDVNADGYVNSTDALLILTFDAELPVPYPLAQPAEEPNLEAQPLGCRPAPEGLSRLLRLFAR